MTIRTNFYGIIGVASTIGKNGFAAGQKVSGWGRDAFHYISPVTDIRIGSYHIFEKLENACEEIRKFDKEVETKFQEWETWAEAKWAEAKAQEEKQEELNQEWISANIGGGYWPHQPSKFQQLGEAIKTKKQKLWPEERYTLPRREKLCGPNYLQRVLGLY